MLDRPNRNVALWKELSSLTDEMSLTKGRVYAESSLNILGMMELRQEKREGPVWNQLLINYRHGAPRGTEES